MKTRQTEQRNGEHQENQRVPGNSKLVNASKYQDQSTNWKFGVVTNKDGLLCYIELDWPITL